MGKNYSKDDAIQYKKKAIKKINTLLEKLLAENDTKKYKKAVLISKWLHNYVNYIEFEEIFEPKKNIAYKRGNIVKVNFGFRVGAELGGVHYAVVLDKNNNHNSDTITVVPLSSIKDDSKIHERDLKIANEFYNLIAARVNSLKDRTTKELNQIKDANDVMAGAIATLKELDDKSGQDTESPPIDKLYQDNAKRITELSEHLQLLAKMRNELSYMKEGSIVKIEQITTISKMRIIDPKHSGNVLSNVSLSENTMKKINEKIKEIYIFQE